MPSQSFRRITRFDVDVVHDLANVRHHLSGKLQLAETQRAAATLAAAPAQKKPTICQSASRPRHPA